MTAAKKPGTRTYTYVLFTGTYVFVIVIRSLIELSEHGKLTITALRKQIYKVVDQALRTGAPVEVERNGKKVLIVPAKEAASKLANLKSSKGIIGDPDALVELKVGEWREPRNLR